MQISLSFMRLRLSEKAALAAVKLDIDELKTRFDDRVTITEEEPQMLVERYADRGMTGCIIRVTIDTGFDYERWDVIANWLTLLQNTAHEETRVGVLH